MKPAFATNTFNRTGPNTVVRSHVLPQGRTTIRRADSSQCYRPSYTPGKVTMQVQDTMWPFLKQFYGCLGAHKSTPGELKTRVLGGGAVLALGSGPGAVYAGEPAQGSPQVSIQAQGERTLLVTEGKGRCLERDLQARVGGEEAGAGQCHLECSGGQWSCMSAPQVGRRRLSSRPSS